MARRVVYLDEAPGFGGSTSGLLKLVAHLSPSRYQGIVVLSYPLAALKSIGQGLPLVSLPLRSAGLPPRKRRQGVVAARLRLLRRLTWDVLPRAWELTRLGRREEVALVHTNNPQHNLAGVLAARLLRVPCVASVRGFRRLGPLARWAFRFVEASFVSTEAQRAHLVQWGLKPERLVRVRYGLTRTELEWGGDGLKFRERLGIPSGCLVYGIVGMLVDWKGHKVFLDAARRIKGSVPGSVAVIVGDTPRPDDPYRQELEACAAARGLNGHVIFAGFCDDPSEAYAAMDVLVHASTFPEPFGRVIIEAMARERAVVASDAGGPQEIITPMETGLLSPPGDAERLAESVVRLLTDPDLRKRLGQAARREVEQVYRIEDEVRIVQDVYDTLLGAR